MEFYWLLPPPRAIKINVHGTTQFVPFPNGNTSGVGMVIRNAEGELYKLSTGILPSNSPLENKLNAIHHGLIKAFKDNFKDIILETDNQEAFYSLKNFHHGTPSEVLRKAQQILILLNDPRWLCRIVYIYPERNAPAIYLARLGGESCSQLYTFSRLVGAVEELLSLDSGFGLIGPKYQDIEIMSDEEDPVDFGSNIPPGAGVIHGGYVFQEEFHVVSNSPHAGPSIMPIHEAVMEDFLFGNGFWADPFAGNFPAAYHF